MTLDNVTRPMHNPIGDRVDSPPLQRLPHRVELGEDPPRDGWVILWDDWLCYEDRVIGVHPKPRRVDGRWVVRYEVVEEMSVEALYAAA